MKRLLARAAVLLAVGAAVTLAIGLFGPALKSTFSLDSPVADAPILPYGHIGWHRSPMVTLLRVTQFAEEGGMPPAMPPQEAWRLLAAANEDGRTPDKATEPWTPHKAIRQTTYFYSGLPLRCMVGSNLSGIPDAALRTAPQVSERVNLLVFNEGTPRQWCMMTKPIWLPLAADTLLFAVLAGVVHAGWVTGVARYRRSRNLCAACGHSRAGLGVGVRCPECGVG